MSRIALNPASPTISERLHALQERLLAGKSRQGRLYTNLKDLPDHLLLDIGVDPRRVPCSAEEAGARPEVLWQEAAAMKFRTAAKS